MPSHDQYQAMPFGYAFEYALQQQSPDQTPRPPGPPLLNELENQVLGNFFNDPDAPNADDTQPFTFGFDLDNEQGVDLSWAIPDIDHVGSYVNIGNYLGSPYAHRTPAASHEHGMQPPTRQTLQHTPLGIQGLGQSQATTGWDEGHMGASALLNLSQNSPGLNRQSNRSSDDFTQVGNSRFSHVTHMQQTNRFMLTNGNLLPSGPSTPGLEPSPYYNMPAPNPGGFPNVPTRTASIPRELMFDTDQNFRFNGNHAVNFLSHAATPPHTTVEGYTADQRSDFVQSLKQEETLERQTSAAMTPVRLGAVKTRPPEVQPTTIQSATKMDVREPATKKRRTQSLAQHEAMRTPHPTIEIKTEGGEQNVDSATSSAAESDKVTPASKSVGPTLNGSHVKTAAKKSSTPASATKRQKLTDEQRKRNHIISEQRRRGNMKEGYDQLDKLVPSLRSGGLSKSQVLQQTVHYLSGLAEANKKLESILAQSTTVNHGGF